MWTCECVRDITPARILDETVQEWLKIEVRELGWKKRDTGICCRERAMAKVVVKDPKIISGEPVFRGTRVPFKALLDYLEGGDTLDQFLEQYPSVSRELAVAALEEARLSLVSGL